MQYKICILGRMQARPLWMHISDQTWMSPNLSPTSFWSHFTIEHGIESTIEVDINSLQISINDFVLFF